MEVVFWWCFFARAHVLRVHTRSDTRTKHTRAATSAARATPRRSRSPRPRRLHRFSHVLASRYHSHHDLLESIALSNPVTAHTPHAAQSHTLCSGRARTLHVWCPPTGTSPRWAPPHTPVQNMACPCIASGARGGSAPSQRPRGSRAPGARSSLRAARRACVATRVHV